MARTFYWHDYETWGVDPRRDRPVQFAGVRTDEGLNVVSEPLVLYCRPADDMLPHPEACLVTGLSPQHALSEGLCEAEFITRVYSELAQPGTCGVGYNSIRFDDEFTRHTLYRNFFDSYAREWQNGNSRWDLIDTVRLAHALRPEHINWPKHADGSVSFRLEHLSAANGIEHKSAHDALSDVHAAIGLAKLLRDRQPRLFDYALSLRDKRRVADLLDLQRRRVVLHVSEKIPAALGCVAPIIPLVRHPTNKNGIVVYDLRQHPQPLIDLDAEAIHARLFTPVAEMPQGQTRIALKTVHINRCPIVTPMSTLTPEAAERWRINGAQVQEHADELLAKLNVIEDKVQAVHRASRFTPETDPDLMLYSGGFFSEADRRAMARVRNTTPTDLGHVRFDFEDPRLPEMLFRYRARNWPKTLSQREQKEWDLYRRQRLSDPTGGGSITLREFRRQVERLQAQQTDEPENSALLDRLCAWADRVESECGMPGT